MKTKLFVLLIFLFSINLFSQTTFSGKVIDEKENVPLYGVNVMIKELKIGTSTNVDGIFTFKNLNSGIYTFVFSYIGHRTQAIKILIPDNNELVVKMIDGNVDLEEIIVTGNPLSLDKKDFAQSSIVISNQNLLIKRNSTIAEILNFQPGISVRSNGTAPSRPIIRGFSNNRILILENGLRMGDLSNSSDDHGVSSDGGNAEKIEVLRGPASLLYGSNAIGGVVNIISEDIPTYVPDHLEGVINFNSSTNNKEYFGNADLHYGISNIAIHANYFNRSNKNYFDGNNEEVFNTDLNSKGYQFGLSYKPNFGLSGFSFSKYNTTYGLPIDKNEIDGEGPILLDMKKNDLRFLFESNYNNSFITTFNLKAGFQDYNHKEIIRNTGEIGTQFSLKSLSSDLSFNHHPIFNEINGIFGLWFMNQDYTVTGEEALTPNANYKSFAMYFYEQTKINKFNFQLGFRYEINKIKIPESELSNNIFSSFNRNYNSISGSFGISYNLNDDLSIYTNISNAFRSPTVEELASYSTHEATGSFDIGEKNLLTEKNYGLDFGFRVIKQYHYVDLSFYYNDINDFIYRDPTNMYYNPTDSINKFNFDEVGFPVFKYKQTNAILFGAELKAQYDFSNSLTTIIVMDYVRGYQKKPFENLPQIPPFRISLETRYTTDLYWFGFNWKVVNKQSQVANFEEPTTGFGLVDLHGGIKLITNKFVHIIDLKINNTFNQLYRDHLSAIKSFAYMPGRKISLNYKFLF